MQVARANAHCIRKSNWCLANDLRLYLIDWTEQCTPRRSRKKVFKAWKMQESTQNSGLWRGGGIKSIQTAISHSFEPTDIWSEWHWSWLQCRVLVGKPLKRCFTECCWSRFRSGAFWGQMGSSGSSPLSSGCSWEVVVIWQYALSCWGTNVPVPRAHWDVCLVWSPGENSSLLPQYVLFYQWCNNLEWKFRLPLSWCRTLQAM